MPKIYFKKADRVVKIVGDAAEAPGGFVLVGEYEHTAGSDSLHEDVHSHVLYHHVQEAMYHKGELDMQRLTILDETTVPLLDPEE